MTQQILADMVRSQRRDTSQIIQKAADIYTALRRRRPKTKEQQQSKIQKHLARTTGLRKYICQTE